MYRLPDYRITGYRLQIIRVYRSDTDYLQVIAIEVCVQLCRQILYQRGMLGPACQVEHIAGGIHVSTIVALVIVELTAATVAKVTPKSIQRDHGASQGGPKGIYPAIVSRLGHHFVPPNTFFLRRKYALAMFPGSCLFIDFARAQGNSKQHAHFQVTVATRNRFR